MCTVTFIPKNNTDFIFTSNRDESPIRETLAPDFYMEHDVKLLYPKDEKAGGTWIGVSEKSRLVCLLNGGFTAHEQEDHYRLSRGVVVKDVLIAPDFLKTIETYRFTNIEPFTMLIVDWEKTLDLYQLVWDGNQKHLKKLPNEPRLWSSSSLYSESMKVLRLEWFDEFKKQTNFQAESIMQFHKTAGHQHAEFGLIMDRGFVKTTSITQVEKCNSLVNMRYTNLQDENVIEKEMLF
ncbi:MULTISPECIES: NRDE family protein [Bizionia]|uniref:NRDE family protein n=1 Tax=Bizionia algoritergicola TaxID=291187 RepID=A0A5D0QVT3_9FLAO|nr:MULTISPECIES: NRDE family protein [Bizionia]OBX21428.1 hypothetical protein BAA08_12810 [Bizionia sp. APA-3]TYB72969.1 NRDE family protein [Bizionia algoritergicola]